MGKHFDALVEFTKRYVDEKEQVKYIPSLKKHLEHIVKQAALFDFPLQSEEIFPMSGKDKYQYGQYLNDYFVMSEEYNSSFITPFNVTAIEDKTSVVILNNLADNEYIATLCIYAVLTESGQPFETISLACGHVALQKPKHAKISMSLLPLYHGMVCNRQRIAHNLDTITYNSTVQDLKTNISAYVEQAIYIMDPENFIIYKESNQSYKLKERLSRKSKSKKKKNNLLKTVMRPHYVCLSADDTKSFLKNESKEPRPAHPVRGHWRILMSERFKKKKGQRIYIKQYFTGDGKIDAREGWHYHVMVKESPKRIVPYR